MSDEFDPEVAADLAFRDASERDTTRTRTANYDWKPDRVVGAWKCRVPKCTNHVAVTQEAYDQLAICNRRLAQVGEEPQIETSDVMYCDRCTVEFKRTAADRRRQHVDRMAEVIQQLKAGESRIRMRTNDGEQWLDELRALEALKHKPWNHPDVKGLEEALKRRRERDNKPNARRSAV